MRQLEIGKLSVCGKCFESYYLAITDWCPVTCPPYGAHALDLYILEGIIHFLNGHVSTHKILLICVTRSIDPHAPFSLSLHAGLLPNCGLDERRL